MPKYSLLFLFFTYTLQSCWIIIDKPPKPTTSNELPRFTDSPLVSRLNTDLLDEASGIEDSYQFPGHLWVHEDNGSRSNFIYLLSHQGIYLERFELPVPIRDWVRAGHYLQIELYRYLFQDWVNPAAFLLLI